MALGVAKCFRGGRFSPKGRPELLGIQVKGPSRKEEIAFAPRSSSWVCPTCPLQQVASTKTIGRLQAGFCPKGISDACGSGSKTGAMP